MKYFLPLLVMLLYINHIQAQSSSAQIQGTVTDDKGNAVAGAAVTIIQTGQGGATTEKGKYTISNITAGVYHIRVNAIGYRSMVVKAILKTNEHLVLPISVESDMNMLNEVNINAKKYNPDNLIDLQRTPMPSMVVTRKQIEQMGSRRLDEVLKEQTGLAIVNDIGSGARAIGLQMQGFDSGYTMILIDGQPMTGRNSGNFDLSRITVANIERIEIIKGASSCLFGSDAMAGVVNIVTRQHVSQSQGMAGVRYGTFNTVDANLEGESPFANGKGSGYIAGNYYRTDGFNANPYLSEGKTVPPYTSYTIQGRAKYMLSTVNTLNFTGRFASRHSVNDKSYTGSPTTDKLDEDDLNGSVVLNTNLSSGLRIKSQYYLTRYATGQNITDLTSNQVTPGNNFTQYLHRGEVQASKMWFNSLRVTSGIGTQYETMDNDAFPGGKHQQNSFLYSQGDWKVSNKVGVIGGFRLEHHSRYGSSLTPSFGINYQPLKMLVLKAAIATGFKTPDFRQLYLVFTNFAGGGYTVLGTEQFAAELKKLQDAGEISAVFPNASKVSALKPERSVSYSAGFTFTPVAAFKIDVNGFYNNVHNFINTDQVASKKGGQQVFTYFNIDKAFLSGLDVGMSWLAAKGLTIAAGYQLLYAKDRGVVDSIKAGTGNYATVYNPNTSEERRSKVSDYFGLTNRSRHMANIRFNYEYEPKGITGTFWVNYRGKYGFQESNRPNGFLDPYDTYVASFFLFNASVQKTLLNKHMAIQLTADNLFNYRDMLMPGQPGRMILAGLNYRFF
ncbi:TonB-dependent receptor [Mucilaginibacter sp. SG564]|uniref:TonB-dependent receptor n=1 Tax=Mucilaginibacter sp. SG564 TaxID=2587022 RepID=UPI001555B142|nr:TonB-dependent receptor [Mucilaginibacter sp. SG564]NOW93698.1 outer membrane receptor for ferrienterochelin and colicins [Mucilaginibacter sp. SG564]